MGQGVSEAQSFRRAWIALALAGLVLRLVGLDWDAGRGFHPDENNLVSAALSLGIDGRLLPEFHAYNDLALWLPRLLSLPFCGDGDRACLALVARGLSALLSAAMVPLGMAIAMRVAQGPARQATGLATAALVALSPPLVQWAHFGTTESAMALLVLLVWWLALRWQAGESTDREMAILCGVALGVGFGFKTTALALTVIPLSALALSGRPLRAMVRPVVLLGLVTVMQALAFAPSVLFATRDWLAVMRFENGVVWGTVPVFWTAQFNGARPVLFELRQLWSITTGAGLLLAALALVVLPRRGWRLVAPGVIFGVIYAAMTFGWHAMFVRYLAPLVPVVLVLAGIGAGGMIAQSRSRALKVAGLTGVGLMALAGLDSAAAYLRADPRIALEQVLQDRAAPTDVVALEPHDLGQAGGLRTVALPLMDPGLRPEALAPALAGADWLLIASRRNWAVLPRQPGAAPVLCRYYAGLADGSLGFVPVARADRLGPLGRLFAPDLAAEETRVVFDRPELFLLRNLSHRPEAEIRAVLSTDRDPSDCAAPGLQRAWRAGP